MPRRSILSASERDNLLALPTSHDDLIRHYTFSETDLSLIRQRRGDANRIGFAVQLCVLRYPGYAWSIDVPISSTLLQWLGRQLRVDPICWQQYAEREETRREHFLELRTYLGLTPFGLMHFRQSVNALSTLASQTDKGIVLASRTLTVLRQQHIILPQINVIERICAEAITLGNRRIYRTLTESLSDIHRKALDNLLKLHPGSTITNLIWMRQSPAAANARSMLEHIGRLTLIEALTLPTGLEREVHQNRLLKIAREGGHMTTQHLRDLEPARRYATLVAVVLEAKATVIDEIVGLHDRIIGALFNRAKHNHEQQFQKSGSVSV